MQNLIATTFEVVHYIALQAVHYKPLEEVHLSRYNHKKWGKYYRSIRKRGQDPSYKAYFTYLNYDHRIQSMIYPTFPLQYITRLYFLVPGLP